MMIIGEVDDYWREVDGKVPKVMWGMGASPTHVPHELLHLAASRSLSPGPDGWRCGTELR
jgi:hypothetical protein